MVRKWDHLAAVTRRDEKVSFTRCMVLTTYINLITANRSLQDPQDKLSGSPGGEFALTVHEWRPFSSCGIAELRPLPVLH